MSSRLRDTIESELIMMRQLLETYADLFAEARAGDPRQRDVAALATVIHSFYGGVEKTLKAINDLLDRRVLGRELWHSQLLAAMAQPSANRGSVLSAALAARLRDYMEFRHLFRHAYVLDLRWSKMQHLVVGIEETFGDFVREIRAFLETVDAGPELPSQ